MGVFETRRELSPSFSIYPSKKRATHDFRSLSYIVPLIQ
ncbi:hypothetical protein CU015_2062 [Enterococcus faecium]|nr:hypothetical protein [Enterococcus faecium]